MRRKIILSMCLLLTLNIQFGCQSLSKMLAKGGTEFKIRVETNEDDRNPVVESAIKITENRLNAIGLPGEAFNDPDDSNGFIVRIYGSQDLERIRKFLFTTYQLELRKVISRPNPSPVQTFPTIEAATQAAKDDQEVLSYKERNDSTGQYVIVEKTAIVNGADIRDARYMSLSGSQDNYTISFSLNRQAATKFGDWTGKNIGNYMAVVLDRKVQSIAFIKSPIFDSGVIEGRFSKEEAEDIAVSLKSGYFPGTMRIVEEKQIGK